MSINSTSSSIKSKLENVLIIGNGGRENSLAWAIQKNELVKKVYLVPGNAGSERINKCERIRIDINNKNELVEKLDFFKINFVVIGPEVPLANGLADFLRKKDYKVFGPGKDGARLEYSKSWAKEFMQDANIPTAKFWKVNSLDEAKEIIHLSSVPLVVKADGLASGKGVFIPDSKDESFVKLISTLAPPFFLIFSVLGSIIFGVASPTEAAGIGALGATLIALFYRKLNLKILSETTKQSAFISSMVFLILIGASIFSLVFRGLGGEELITEIFNKIPGGLFGSMILVMLLVFILGFILDFIEITFIVVPIVGPILMVMGADPLWLGIMLAINLQTSFLTPPFGFALFYLRSVTPEQIKTETMYQGVLPFIIIQIFVLCLVAYFPTLATYLPKIIF